MLKEFRIAVITLGLGALALPLSAAEKNEKNEEHEDKEEVVEFKSVPQPVQKTLTKEADGAKIDKVDKEEDDGKVIYEADVMMNGKNYEIKVAQDGTLICKKLDMEDEKDEKNEKDNDKDSK